MRLQQFSICSLESRDTVGTFEISDFHSSADRSGVAIALRCLLDHVIPWGSTSSSRLTVAEIARGAIGCDAGHSSAGPRTGVTLGEPRWAERVDVERAGGRLASRLDAGVVAEAAQLGAREQRQPDVDRGGVPGAEPASGARGAAGAGAAPRSTAVTRRPARARWTATLAPITPAPITTASGWLTRRTSRVSRRGATARRPARAGRPGSASRSR